MKAAIPIASASAIQDSIVKNKHPPGGGKLSSSLARPTAPRKLAQSNAIACCVSATTFSSYLS